LIPGALVVAMADPDVEVRVDPGTREDAFEYRSVRRARLGHRHRRELSMALEPAVQGAQEGPAAAVEMLPGVFSVQNDGDEGLFPAGARTAAAAGAAEPARDS